MNSPTILSAKWNRIITLDDLINTYEIDRKLYEVLKFKANVYEWQQKDPEWNPVILQLHQVSAEFKPIREVVNYRDVLSEVFNEWIKSKRSKKWKDWDLLMVIPQFDAHIDKYSNGTESYIKEVNDRMMDVFEKGRKAGADRVLYINGWDYFNSDWKYKTTKWTEQLNSMTEKESFKYGLKDQIQLIENFSRDMQTDVMYLSGNHDDLKLQALSDAVDIYFSKDNKVEVNNDDEYRKYFDWGTTTIGAGHGDGVNEKNILSVFAQEKWLNVNNYYLKWHIHHQLKQLYGNLVVETFWTTSRAWEWDKKMGYVWEWAVNAQLYDKKDWKYGEFQK